MPLDSSIPLQSNAPDPMASLSGMLDIGAKSLSLAKNRATFDADVARSKAQSSTAESKASVDQQSINAQVARTRSDSSTAESSAFVANANRGAAVQHATATANAATTGADSASVDLQNKKRKIAQQSLSQILTDKNLNELDPEKYDPKKAVASLAMIRDAAIAGGYDPHELNMLTSTMMNSTDKPGGAIGIFKGRLLSQVGAIDSISATKPDYQRVSAGDRTYTSDANTTSPTYNPNAGKNVAQNLSPTQSTINSMGQQGVMGAAPAQPGDLGYTEPKPGMPTNERDAAIGRATSDISALRREAAIPGKNAEQMQILNSEHAKAQAALQQAQAMPVQGTTKPTPGFMPTTLVPGQEANLKDNTEAMNAHFAKISGAASDAPLALSLVSNIKSLANGAITGTLQGRTAYVNGLLNSVHLGDKISGDLQKDTDLLEKYMSQLNLSTPAATNAAREIITAARPHGTMIKGALTEAADQIGSVVNSNLAQRNHLASYKFSNGGKGDAVGYDTEKRNIESIADPRIFQMQGKSRDEIKAYMAKLPIADQQELVMKSALLHKMGITK